MIWWWSVVSYRAGCSVSADGAQGGASSCSEPSDEPDSLSDAEGAGYNSSSMDTLRPKATQASDSEKDSELGATNDEGGWVAVTNLKLPMVEDAVRGTFEQLGVVVVDCELGGSGRCVRGRGRAWVESRIRRAEDAVLVGAAERFDSVKLPGRNMRVRLGYWVESGATRVEEEI